MNEEQLKKVVAEAVNRIINEGYPTPSRRVIAKSDLFGHYGEYEHGKHGYGNDKGWHAGYGNPLNGILKATGEINSCLIDFEYRFQRQGVRSFDYDFFMPADERKNCKQDPWTGKL